MKKLFDKTIIYWLLMPVVFILIALLCHLIDPAMLDTKWFWPCLIIGAFMAAILETLFGRKK